MSSLRSDKVGPAIKNVIDFALEAKWALVFTGAGLLLIVLGFVYPELGGFLAWMLDVIFRLFSPNVGSNPRRDRYEEDISDPWNSFCAGGGLLLVGLGWLAIEYLNKQSEPEAPPPE